MSKQFTLDFKLSPDATFGHYKGPAAARLRAVDHWGLIWGESGSGRSHLLQAACHEVEGGIYLTDLARLSPEIIRDLERLPLVCLDDLDAVLGDAAWEEALFHLMNGIKDQGGRLLVSSEQPASQLPVKLGDLKSRLKAADSIETDRLNDDEKLEVLMQRARHWGFSLGTEVGRFILSRSPRNMGQLLQRLKRIELETLRQHKRVTIPFVKDTLQL